jgi:hypothetical protein
MPYTKGRESCGESLLDDFSISEICEREPSRDRLASLKRRPSRLRRRNAWPSTARTSKHIAALAAEKGGQPGEHTGPVQMRPGNLALSTGTNF